jgi:PERQ amino acid-rich with GYF domain-containing protein
MHEWYTTAYFDDELPVRRAHESGFHTLAELKQSTANAIRPFLSAIRPRAPPPNLPLPGSMPQHMMPLNDNFRNLNIHPGYAADPRLAMGPQMGMPQYAPPFRNDAPFSPNHYGPQQGFLPNPLQSPGFIGNPGQSWAGPGGPGSRFNGPGAFGSPAAPSPIGTLPGHYSQIGGAFSPAIGGPVGRGPEFFSPSVGAGAIPGSIPTSPWALPPQQHQQQAPQQMYPQHQQQEQPQSINQTFAQPSQPEEYGQTQQDGRPSYFPQNDQEPSIPPPDVVESINEQPVNEAEPEVPAAPAAEASQADQAEAADTIDEPTSTGPPASVWGAIPTSRRSSLTQAPASAQMSPTPAAATTQASAKSSKAAAIPKETIAEPAPTLAAAIETPDREKSNNTPKPAPWAVKDDKEVKTPSGPSLREIQEAEAKVAAARKQALAEMRASNAAPSPVPSAVDDMPTSMSWGLPQQGSKPAQVSSPSVSSPAAPVWGSGDAAGPKKTMKQIQEEEEKRRMKLAHAKAQVQGVSATPTPTGTPTAKRGYADLAASSAPPSGSGWQTVGSAGKGVPGSAAPPAAAARPAAVTTKSAIVTPSKPATPAPVSRPAKSDETPSADFIRWTKQSLNGLNVNSKFDHSFTLIWI